MNELEFQNILKGKGIEVSERQLKQFQKYYEILVEWNEKMNLTAITDKEDVYLKHFYDSITIAFDFDFNDQTLIDVGAGAGFPSVPLKILYPNLKITIVDSLNKRITFLNHLFKELELDNCKAVAARAEEYAKDHRESVDIVMARAVARLNILDELCLPLVKKEGYFLSLKGRQASEEVKEATKGIQLLGGEIESTHDFTLANHDDFRSNIIIKKVKETPKKYPRMFSNNKLKNIDINKIQANVNQPRTVFNETKIDELAASIKENGLIQPIVVRKNNGVYQIIAGERRYRACRLLNMKQVPCIIEDYTDKQTQTLAIIENIQREDLSPLEEAKAYQALIKEYDYNQTELAEIVGKKQSTIANKLRLLKLSDDVQFSLNQKQITERHARAMLSLDEEKQQEVLREVLKKKLTVADTEKLIKKEPKPKKKKAEADVKKTISRNVKIALNTLNQAITMIEKTGTSLQQKTEDLEDEYVITIRIHK